MPQLDIRDKQFLTVSAFKTFYPVKGLTPPFERVAAIIANASVESFILQHYV